jgi:hypothetical protein
MAWRITPKQIKYLIFAISTILLVGGSVLFWAAKNQEEKLANAQALNDDVQVMATVLPSNPTLGYTTIFIGSGTTPTVTVNDITVNNNPTNLPITCTIYYGSPGGQSITVTTVTQNINDCQFNPAIPPDNQNAEVVSGNTGDITDIPGVGTVQVSVSLAGSTIQSPLYNYKVTDLTGGPNLNVQNLQPAIDLRSNLSDPSDLVAKLNLYTGVIVATAIAVTGYIVIFFNIVNSFRITKFRDFTEELNVGLDIYPREISTGEPMRFVSKIYDETDKPVNNLECVLTIVTPAKNKIKVQVLTNKNGICGIYITKEGKIDNETAALKENLHPATIERGDLRGFNDTPGHGIAYVKAKIYSSRYHSRQVTWTVKDKN